MKNSHKNRISNDNKDNRNLNCHNFNIINVSNVDNDKIFYVSRSHRNDASDSSWRNYKNKQSMFVVDLNSIEKTIRMLKIELTFQLFLQISFNFSLVLKQC